MNDVEIYIKKRGQNEYALSSVMGDDFHVLQAYMGSPQITPTYDTMAGSDGTRLSNISFGQTTLTIVCLIKGKQKSDFRLMRDDVYKQFYGREVIQVRSGLEPAKAMYVVPKPIEILPENGFSGVNFAFQLDVLEGYRHTPFKSEQINSNQDKLQYGMNLDLEDLPEYQFKQNVFNLYNPSDIAVDPYIQHHELKWIIKGSGTDVKVTNNTNKTSFAIPGTFNSFTLNGVTGTQKTDFGHIVLEKGNNVIQVTGLKDTDITVSFPFLYF